MFDANRFFQARFVAHLKETSRYLRYIFTGHLMIAALFFISALSYYYQRWLLDIPENFPAALIIALVFGLAAGYSPVRTLLQEPDLVFLLPAEHKMGPYFRNALIYSFAIQFYLILLAGAALGPLYFAAFPDRSGRTYLLLLLGLFLLKVFHLFASWWVLRKRDQKIRTGEYTARLLFTIVMFYFVLGQEWLLAGLAFLLLTGIILYDYVGYRENRAVTWDLLIEKDRLRMQAFYRVANMFTDVPHLKNRIKKRHWLVNLLTRRIPFRQEQTFNYLYKITTVRSGDYLGLYLRLLLIGAVAIYYVPSLWVKVAFSLLFLYLSGFQLMTIWNHHQTIAWLDLYPVKKEWRKQALIRWLSQLLLVQVFLFGLLFLFAGSTAGMALVWAGGALFSLVFINGYVKKRLV